MIIFTPIKDMHPDLLIEKDISSVIKYNLSSYYADIPSVDLLLPSSMYIPEDVLNGDCSNADFDIAYHRYIIDNNSAFIQFMSIMVPEYTIPDILVQILIDTGNFRDAISESLSKLIQQRYGCNSYYILSQEDFIYTEFQTFSIPGLFTMDKDIARWQMLVGTTGDFRDE